MPRHVAAPHHPFWPQDRNGSCVTNNAVHTAMRNCTRDEGRPFGFGEQVADPKPPQAAVVKSDGGERCGNVGAMIPAGKISEAPLARTVRPNLSYPVRCQSNGSVIMDEDGSPRLSDDAPRVSAGFPG